MLDFVGADLAINDYVVIRRPDGRGLVLGKISAITDKRVKVSHELFTVWQRVGQQARSTNVSIVNSKSCVKVPTELALLQVLSKA